MFGVAKAASFQDEIWQLHYRPTQPHATVLLKKTGFDCTGLKDKTPKRIFATGHRRRVSSIPPSMPRLHPWWDMPTRDASTTRLPPKPRPVLTMPAQFTLTSDNPFVLAAPRLSETLPGTQSGFSLAMST